jgi:hypothetical protein
VCAQKRNTHIHRDRQQRNLGLNSSNFVDGSDIIVFRGSRCHEGFALLAQAVLCSRSSSGLKKKKDKLSGVYWCPM